VIDLCGYEGLLARTPYTREFIPWLCYDFVVTTWEPTPGDVCTAINFTLLREAYWSDGTPITFNDINYTFVQMKYDLAARGLPDPWWISNVQNIVQMINYSDTTFEVRLDVKSVFAVGWIGGNRIMPMHIWKPICTGQPRPSDGTPWDPTTFAPDINIIHSGAWCFDDYAMGSTILMKAHKAGITVQTTGISDPNWLSSSPILSPKGFFRYGRPEDPNNDGKVNVLDAIMLSNSFGTQEGGAGAGGGVYNRRLDFNGDGRINVLDAIMLANWFGWPNKNLNESPIYPI
jgi:hypothetical protein